MIRCTIVDEPKIEDDAVVLRVVHEDPDIEDAGRVFVCRMTSFDSMTVEEFPKGSTPNPEGEYRAEAAEAAREYLEENRDKMRTLFYELSRK